MAKSKDTLLHKACQAYVKLNDRVSVVTALLRKYKLNPNAGEYCGSTPLHFAVMYGYADCLEVLIKHGGQVNATNKWDQNPLHTAAVHERIPCMQILLKHSSNKYARDTEGNNPLEHAKKWNRKKSVEFLQKYY